ncbi:MAG: hypothetical protein U0903_18895 [Planctomycetales bacterium]
MTGLACASRNFNLSHYRMIQLLDYYFAFTRDADWERGSRPVVYQSLAKTALDLSVTERQVQRLE